MRLSGKFIFACTLVFTFLAAVTATSHTVTFIKKGAAANTLEVGPNTITFSGNDLGKIWNDSTLLYAGVGIAGTIAGPAISDGDDWKMTLDNGDVITLTVTSATTGKTITAAYTPGSAAATKIHPIKLANIDLTGTSGHIKILPTNTITELMTSIAIPDPERAIVSAALATTTKGLCSFTGGYAISKKSATGTEELVAAAYHYCYQVTDSNMYLCVKWTSAGACTISVRPGPLPGKMQKVYKTLGGPALVTLLGLVGAILSAYFFSIVDPEGYQAGKEASSLPEFIKTWLPDAEGYGGERYYDEEDTEVYKVDPSTGRTIRVKRAGSAVGGDDIEGSPVEKTDASAFTVLAALLAVPFLL